MLGFRLRCFGAWVFGGWVALWEVCRTLHTWLRGQRSVWEGCRQSRRYSRDTYPDSYITKYTSIRRFVLRVEGLFTKCCYPRGAGGVSYLISCPLISSLVWSDTHVYESTYEPSSEPIRLCCYPMFPKLTEVPPLLLDVPLLTFDSVGSAARPQPMCVQ